MTNRTNQASAGDVTLLVSVRDMREYELVAQADVDIIDLKEPRRGALAATSVEVWRGVASAWQRYHEDSAAIPALSAALGERDESLAVARSLPATFSFAKAGPSGCDCRPELLELWSKLRGRLQKQTELVAVAYADYLAAGCLHPEQILQSASDAGLKRCLIDTYRKDGRSAVDHLGKEGLQRIELLAGRLDMWWALAGSMTLDTIRWINQWRLRPDCIGVRGAVCDGGRSGDVSRARIDELRTSMSMVAAATT